MNYSPSFRCHCIRLYYFTQFKYWESKLRKLTAKELLADWDGFPYPGRTQNLYSSRRMFTILRWLCPWLISFCLSTKFKAGSSLSGLPLYQTLLNIFYNFFFWAPYPGITVVAFVKIKNYCLYPMKLYALCVQRFAQVKVQI